MRLAGTTDQSEAMNQDLTTAQIEKVNQDLTAATRSDATLLTLEQVDQPTGTCFLCLDQELLQCFHVFCRSCCNQLLVHRDPESQEMVLQCTTCRSCELYPPRAANQSDQNHKKLITLVQYDNVSCELLSVVTKKKTTCSVRKTGPGLCLYEISYQPSTRGEHQLIIKVDGEQITGSPFTVVVRAPVETLGRPMMVLRSLQRPWGVVVGHDGRIIVAEHDSHRISTCCTSGKKAIFGVSRDGKEDVSFTGPRGIAVDKFGNLFVVDGKLCCVQKFTSNGQLIAKIGKKGKQSLEFSSPVGIGIHPHTQRIYIADNCNNRIQILTPDLEFYKMFGRKGSGDGEMEFPWDIAFDSVGRVFVADSWNNRIQVFTEEGGYVSQIGRFGTMKGELAWPSSIWIDAEDVLYITEAQNHRVSVFNTDGVFLTSFGRQGTNCGEFVEPTGITVDRYRVVYVSDSGNNRLQLF